MKKNFTVPVKLNDDMLRRLIIICGAEGRTPENQFIFMLRNYIAYYEKTHGRITPEQLKNARTDEFNIFEQNIIDE